MVSHFNQDLDSKFIKHQHNLSSQFQEADLVSVNQF